MLQVQLNEANKERKAWRGICSPNKLLMAVGQREQFKLNFWKKWARRPIFLTLRRGAGLQLRQKISLIEQWRFSLLNQVFQCILFGFASPHVTIICDVKGSFSLKQEGGVYKIKRHYVVLPYQLIDQMAMPNQECGN